MVHVISSVGRSRVIGGPRQNWLVVDMSHAGQKEVQWIHYAIQCVTISFPTCRGSPWTLLICHEHEAEMMGGRY